MGLRRPRKWLGLRSPIFRVVKDVVAKEGIDCDFGLTRIMDVFLHEGQAAETKPAYDELVKWGLDCVKDVHFTGSNDAELV
jgi:hypothetical protein